MEEHEVLVGSLLEESWLTLEQVAAACAVEASARPANRSER